MKQMRLTWTLALVTLSACSNSLSPEDFYGVWGGEGARLTLSSTQAYFETTCWAGDLAIPVQVKGDEFTAIGTITAQGGAGGHESRAITLRGELTANVLHLTVETSLTSSFALGPFTLQREHEANIPGCP